MSKQATVTLNTGAKMPMIGLGTWLCSDEEIKSAVKEALKAGYRLIDCARFYGNEAAIGEALQDCFKLGIVKREDVFITSKLWGDAFAPEDVLPACQTSLKDLQLDYLDLYLVHTPVRFRKGSTFPFRDDERLGYDSESTAQCWAAMEELYSKGLAKAIGVSNFSITKTDVLLKTAKIIPAVNQVECHLYFQQQKLRDYSASKGIIVEAYSPLGSPARPGVKDDEPVVMNDPVIKDIAEKRKISPAQVCLSFCLGSGLVVIPKSVNAKRIKENFESMNIFLDDNEMKQMKDIDKNFRIFKAEVFLKPGETWQEIWDVEPDEKFKLQ